MKREGHTIEQLLEENVLLQQRNSDLEARLTEAKEQLSYIENHYKDLVEKAGIAILTDNEAGNIRYFNNRFVELFGYTPEEMRDRSILTIVHPDSVGTVKQFHRQRIEGRSVPAKYEFKGIRKDGTIMFLEVDVVELVEHGNVVGTRSYLWDVTERHRVEEALRESESRYRILIEQASDGILIADSRGNIVDVNKNGCAMLGYNREEMLRLSLINLITGGSVKANLARFDQILEGKELVKEYQLRCKTGGTFPAEVSSKLLPDNRLLSIVRDITERKQMEEELLKAQKLQSIGMLAGGIAHDFNNVLTGVLGNISLAKVLTPSETKAAKKLEEAEKATHRAKDLVKQFITFSRGGKPIKKHRNVSDFLKDTVKFALSGSRTRSRVVIARDLMPVEIDAGQVRQVIHNIVVNAREAMPDGGRLRVNARNIHLETDDSPPLPPGDYVSICFKDNGPGIAAEHLPRIYDPYFTTREKRKGMGLAAAYSIMKNHDGYIKVESVQGEGTTFFLYFHAAEAQEKPVSLTLRAHARFLGKVMVMDDEEVVRDVAGEMLRHLGFDVAFAVNGKKAIDLYKNKMSENGSKPPFDLVIMDLTVPDGMGGVECLQRLRKVDPRVKALVSSGYSREAAMANFQHHGFLGVVDKPYKLNDLKDILIKVLPDNLVT